MIRPPAVIISLIAPIILLRAISPTKPTTPSTRIVWLNDASVAGVDDSNGMVTHYRGIPYAHPPVGERRLRLPEPLPDYDKDINASKFGLACPNQVFETGTNRRVGKILDRMLEAIYYRKWGHDGENCLSLNVVVPRNSTAFSNLPVVVWVHGGAFIMGSTEHYPAENLVRRSVVVGQPIIYVSFNYRVGVLGFLGGKEVKKAGVGNLGLQDQRLALRWVQKYIASFGGDPQKVTLWGQSAGAMSVGTHLVTNGGDNEGLFRAAVMQSGAPLPAGDITNGQAVYDLLASKLNCAGKPDTLQCIRETPFDALRKASNDIPGWYLPRLDGVFLKDPPFSSIANGSIPNIPYIIGTVGDEGTIFALLEYGLESEAQFAQYISTRFLPNASKQEVAEVLRLYKNDPKAIAHQNALTSGVLTDDFWRTAKIEGDFVFNMPKRYFLRHAGNKQNVWNYVSLKGKSGTLGAYHTSEVAQIYEEGAMQEYLIRFVVNLDPNAGPGSATLIHWPKWTPPIDRTLIISDSARGLSIGGDLKNVEQLDYVEQMALKYPA